MRLFVKASIDPAIFVFGMLITNVIFLYSKRRDFSDIFSTFEIANSGFSIAEVMSAIVPVSLFACLTSFSLIYKSALSDKPVYFKTSNVVSQLTFTFLFLSLTFLNILYWLANSNQSVKLTKLELSPIYYAVSATIILTTVFVFALSYTGTIEEKIQKDITE